MEHNLNEIEEKILDFLEDKFSGSIISRDKFRGDWSFFIKPNDITLFCKGFLNNYELDIKYLSDMTSVDWFDHEEEKKGRFEVVYNFYSLKNKIRFFLKARLPAENPEIDSITNYFASADWMEREIFDLMGIKFKGHPDLRKILTPDDLEGHPLRRDYPLTWEQPVFTWNKDDPPEVIK